MEKCVKIFLRKKEEARASSRGGYSAELAGRVEIKRGEGEVIIYVIYGKAGKLRVQRM